MTDASARELIEIAVRGERDIREDELRQILLHDASVGFDPHARERVRGRLAETTWRGSVLKGSDTLPPDVVHYLWHVITRREWPVGTSLHDYIESLRAVVLDPSSGVLVFHY